MIVEFTDNVAGTPIYVNPFYVLTDPLHATLIKLSDGESIEVRGTHTEIAGKPSEPSGVTP